MGRLEIGSSENKLTHSISLRLEMASATIYFWQSNFLDLCWNLSGWAFSRIIRT